VFDTQSQSLQGAVVFLYHVRRFQQPAESRFV